MDLKLIFAIFIGKLIFFVVRTLNIGGGSAAPGLYALKIDPKLIEKLSSQIKTNIVITGTNGKTTTARIIAHLISGKKILRNTTGSNLERGIASTLIGHSNILASLKNTQIGIWELDEFAFNLAVPKLKPGIIVFLNVYRDQLDRYGEVDTVIKNWQKTLSQINWPAWVLLNNNDQNIMKLAGTANLPWEVFQVDGVNNYQENSLTKAKIKVSPQYTGQIIQNRGLAGFDLEVKSPKEKIILKWNLPGVYHVFDLLAALAVCDKLGQPLSEAGAKLINYHPAFGRVEKINIQGKESYIFLIKNPIGATMVLETLKGIIQKDDSLLIALNDNLADGTDVSWIWDSDFELLQNSNIFISGTRALDLAVRLKYAGLDPHKFTVQNDLRQAFSEALQQTKQRLFIMPTYTALLELQKILAQKGLKKDYWREEN